MISHYSDPLAAGNISIAKRPGALLEHMERGKFNADWRNDNPVSASHRLIPVAGTTGGMLGVHARSWLTELDSAQMASSMLKTGKSRSKKAAWIRMHSAWIHEFLASSLLDACDSCSSGS